MSGSAPLPRDWDCRPLRGDLEGDRRPEGGQDRGTCHVGQKSPDGCGRVRDATCLPGEWN